MAILEKIRSKSGLLIGVVGVAMLAFIIGDFFNSGRNPFSSTNVVGEIDGHEMHYNAFFSKVKELQEKNTNYSTSDAIQGAWNELEKEIIMGEEFEKLGLSVSDMDIYNEMAKNPQIKNEPILKDSMGNFSMDKLIEYAQYVKNNPNQNPQAYKSWIDYENQLRKYIPGQIYSELVTSGLLSSYKEGELEYKFENEKLTANYVFIPYSQIENDSININDNDLLEYMKKNNLKNTYKSQSSADIQYCFIKIEPSENDLNTALNSLNNLMKNIEEYDKETKKALIREGFKTTKNDSTFVLEYSDGSYNNKFIHKFDNEDLNKWVKTASKGDIFGPYKENDSYKISKLEATRIIPDSVEVRHILISHKDLGLSEKITRNKEDAKKLVDSLFVLIKNNRNKFKELAIEFSDANDNSNQENPGYLNWITYGTMVTPFNNFCFNTGKKGDIKVVETRFGYHIIEILNQKNISKAYKLAILEKKIYTSEETDNQAYEKISKLSNRNYANLDEFIGFAKELNLETRTLEGATPLDYKIQGIEGEQRNIIKWAFNTKTKIGETKLFDMSSGYLVSYLYNRKEEGTLDYERIERELKPIILNKKKSELILKRIPSNTNTQDLQEIANIYSTQIKSIISTTFSTDIVSEVGRDPKLIGALFGLKDNIVSNAIEGDNGIFFAKIIERTDAPNIENYFPFKKQLENRYKSKGYEFYIFESLKKTVKVKDNRANFF